MTTPICAHLDAYIGGWLSEEQRFAFEAHLGECLTCAAELSKQECVDRLLAAARTQLEPAPPLLAGRIERQLSSSPPVRPVRWLWAGLSAAAVLLLGLLLPVAQRHVPRLGPVISMTEPPGIPTEDRTRPDMEDRQAALQQLAVLITSRSQRVEMKAHPWLRLATIPAPGEPRSARRRSAAKQKTPEHQPSDIEDGKEVRITRGLPPYNARAILSRRTLGQRKLSETSLEPAETSGRPGHKHSET